MRILPALVLALLVAPVAAQQQEPLYREVGQDDQGLGRYKLGPVYVTPYFHVANLGVDTNVFYTATDRHADFSILGGPGVRTAVAAGRDGRFFVDGELDYLFFLRTESQRKLTGAARGGYAFEGVRFKARASEEFIRTFERPDTEIDERVLEDQWTTSVTLWTLVTPRLALLPDLQYRRIRAAPDQSFAGSDLEQTLNRDESRAMLGSETRLTPKTFAIVEGGYEGVRYPLIPTRDADSYRFDAGARVDSTTRLTGRAVAGLRLVRPLSPLVTPRTYAYFDVDLRYRFAPHTLLRASFKDDVRYSSLVTVGPDALGRNQELFLRLEKGLVARLELYLWGGLTWFTSDSPVVVESGGQRQVGVRDDRQGTIGADLGYRFHNGLRAGVAVSYNDRQSSFSSFGVNGLLVGGTLNYTPGAKN